MITTLKEYQLEYKHQLTDVNNIKKFILAGKAIFTLESTRTGNWFTYKVNKKEFKNRETGEVEKIYYFVSILRGPRNDSDYTYLGIINPKFYVNTTSKSKISNDSISFKALHFFVSYLRKGELHDEINFYHEGVCGKCGRKLTTPSSVSVGLGPICRSYDEPKKVSNIRKRLKK